MLSMERLLMKGPKDFMNLEKARGNRTVIQ